MDTLVGKTLSHYRIVEKIGAGGMGEVYRARDTRLGRDVAIKVIPAELSRDPDRIRRFEQEARAAGALNHPNVCAVYDVGTHEGSPYVVMELLEGASLHQRLSSGRVPLRKALDYAAQIAHGLSAAHEKGIVHRDLKPGNVFVTRDGRVKVLDFGLAKLTRPGVLGASGETTASIAATETGTILGTVGYMSPEQVRGQAVDHRSDIFSLGAILYELLTGKRAFQGASHVETLNAILNEDPAPVATDGSGRVIPQSLDLIVRRCLEKSPEQRFQSVRDLAFDLEALIGIGMQEAGLAVPGRRRKCLVPVFVTTIVACAVIAAVSLVLLQRQRSVTNAAGLKFTQLTFGRGALAGRFLPGGNTVFYSAAWNGQPWEVFETRPGLLTARSLGLRQAVLHSISKDGMLLIKPGASSLWDFGSGLAQAPITGGTPRPLYDDVAAADWHPDGRTLAIVRRIGGKDRLELPPGRVLYETSGTRDAAQFTEAQGSLLQSPRCSPDGRRVAFTEFPYGGMASGRIVVVDTTGKVESRSPEFPSYPTPAWSPDGREVWFNAGVNASMTEIRAMTRDGAQRTVARLRGWIVVQDIDHDGRVLMYENSQRGSIRGRGSSAAQEVDLSWLDYSVATDISRDGETLLFHEEGAGVGSGFSTYVRRMDGSPAVQLGAGRSMGLSPDGKWALALQEGESQRLVLLPTVAGDSLVLPKARLGKYFQARWMPDGKRLLVTGSEPGRAWRSYVQNIADGSLRPVTPEGIIASLVSPDGRRVIYVAGERYYVMPMDADSGRAVADQLAGEMLLQWSSDGGSIYTVQTESASSNHILRLDLATGRRALWRTITIEDPAGFYPYSAVITPDGQAYAFTYGRNLSTLYLVEGLK